MEMTSIINSERKLHYIPISAIDTAGDSIAVRRFYDSDKLVEMSSSIKEKGMLQPILVRSKKDAADKYELVLGSRRLKSALLAGLKEVPCVIENVDDKEALEIALTENMQREDLTPLEEAWGILKLIKDFGYNEKMVCKRLSKSFDYVNSRLKLLALPEGVQKAVFEGKLGVKQVTPLVELSSAIEQEEAAEEIIRRSLTTDGVKELVATKKSELRKSASIRKKSNKICKEINSGTETLTRLLKGLNAQEVPLDERESVRASLIILRGAIDEAIQKIEESD